MLLICLQDTCQHTSPPTNPDCKHLTRNPDIARSLKRVYIKEGGRILLCPKPAATRKYGWCKIKDPLVR